MSATESRVSISTGLLDRVLAREPEAWDRLVRLYGPLVYRWGRRAGLQDSDAADVVQETFAGVARAIDRFDRDRPGGTFRGWLWTISRNEVRKVFNRLRDRPAGVGGSTHRAVVAEIPDWIDDDEPPGVDTETRLLHRALGIIEPEFEPRTWTAFRRTAIDDEGATDVAADLGVTPGAVRQAKYRVLCRLREMLDGESP